MSEQVIILKFGGASLSYTESFHTVADLIVSHLRENSRIVVVVSAMQSWTDQLLKLSYDVHPNPPRREQDMLVSVGERMSMALLAMALDRRGIKAISLTGSQSGIITNDCHCNASILDVKPERIRRHLEEGCVVIVAGFQGVSTKKEVTTLGRGGSDTTAVALAVALDAEKVVFYKDVPGVYSEDPKKNVLSKPFPILSYGEALAIVEKGAKILHPRSLLLAKENQIPLLVKSFCPKEEFLGTWISGYSERVYLPKVYELQEIRAGVSFDENCPG